MGTVATKAIRKGDEIFLSYGEGYWLSRSDSRLEAKEHADVLVEIEEHMAERRTVKKAHTLTAPDGVRRPSTQVTRATTSMAPESNRRPSTQGAAKTESRDDRRNNKKNKKNKNSRDEPKKKGFGM